MNELGKIAIMKLGEYALKKASGWIARNEIKGLSSEELLAYAVDVKKAREVLPVLAERMRKK